MQLTSGLRTCTIQRVNMSDAARAVRIELLTVRVLCRAYYRVIYSFPRTLGPFNVFSLLDLFAWCVGLSWLLVGF